MAQTNYTPIQLYRSTTPAAAPSGVNLSAGELAINTADEKIFFKNSGGSVVLYTGNPLQTGNAGKFLTTDGANQSWTSTFGSAVNYNATQTIASAATTDIAAATSNSIIVSGTTTITALGTIAAGAERMVVFSGALTLTHNAVSLILPGGASITTAAGDSAYFVSLGSGNWRCTGYQKANGQAVVVSGGGGTLNGITAATGSATINNAENAIVWNWDGSTASRTGFAVSENSASTGGSGSQVLLRVGTLAASTADPLQVQTRGVDTIRVSRLGAVTITGLNGTTGSGTTGSAITITAGQGQSTNAGGAISVTTGQGGTSLGASGALTLATGLATSGVSGAITIQTGISGPSLATGDINITVGTPGSSGLAGILTLTGGASRAAQSGNSGGVVITGGATGTGASIAGGPVVVTGGAGSTTTTGGVGGAVNITAGAGGLAAAGGALTLSGGAGGATGSGGAVNVSAGARGSTGTGSNVNLTASNGSSGVGGDITLTTGTGSTNGAINFVNTNVANGSVATTVTSLGPTGSATTIQGWLAIKVGGTARYIPFW